jgi:hypothetical protein
MVLIRRRARSRDQSSIPMCEPSFEEPGSGNRLSTIINIEIMTNSVPSVEGQEYVNRERA